MYYEALRRRVGYFKNHKGGKKMMCDVIQELVEKAEKGAEKQGCIKGIIKILLNKFSGMDFDWVKECNEKQLNKIDDNILLNISYNDFYKLIHS